MGMAFPDDGRCAVVEVVERFRGMLETSVSPASEEKMRN